MSLHHHVQIAPPVSSSYEISILPFCFICFGTYQPFIACAESWLLNLHVQLMWGVYLNPEQLSILDSFKMVGYHFRYVLYPL